MSESKYFKYFTGLPSEIREKCVLKDNLILVERLEFEVKTASGIIVPGSKDLNQAVLDDKPEWYIVLDLGEGYEDSEGKKSRDLLEVKVGNICLIPRLSVRTFYHYGNIKGYQPNSVGISTSNSAQFIFEDLEAFNTYFREIGNER